MADPANENPASIPASDFEEFVASIRKAMHDFNNVLTSMMGWAELGQTLELDERGAAYLKDIFEAGKRGQELIHGVQQHLLEISRTQPAPVDTLGASRESPQSGVSGTPAADAP